MLPHRSEWTWEQWQWSGSLHSPMLPYYWSLTIRLFSIISRTLMVVAVGSYPSAEMQTVYSTASADWPLFKWSTTVLNSKFSTSATGCFDKAKEKSVLLFTHCRVEKKNKKFYPVFQLESAILFVTTENDSVWGLLYKKLPRKFNWFA